MEQWWLILVTLYSRVAEPCHFSAAPALEPSIFFTAPAPAPTYIASHQFLKINAYGTLFFFTKLLHAWVTWGPFRPEVGSVLILST